MMRKNALLLTATIGALIIMFTGSLFAQEPIAPYRWEMVTNPAEFSRRDGIGFVSFKGKLFLLGGWLHDPPHISNDIWVSEDNGQHWKMVGQAPWAPRHSGGAVIFDNKIWMISGKYKDVWSSTDGYNWTEVTADAPWGMRYAPYVAVFKNKLWLMGGLLQWDDQGRYLQKFTPMNDVWSSTDGKHWTLETTHAPWAPRGMVHGYVVHDNKLWIMGGGHKGPLLTYEQKKSGRTIEELRKTARLQMDIIRAYNDVWSSEDGKHWTRVTKKASWHPRIHVNVTTYDGKMFIVAGSVGTQANHTNDVWYSADGKQWSRLNKTPWSERHVTAFTIHNSELYMAAGWGAQDVWKLVKQH